MNNGSLLYNLDLAKMCKRIQTYCPGFRYELKRDITYDEFAKICAELTKEFGTTIAPEGISEGGLVFSDIRYKTIRLSLPSCISGSKGYCWPWIKQDWRAQFVGNNEVLLKEDYYVRHRPYTPWTPPRRTWLKAFYDADYWTMEELMTVAGVLEKHDWVITDFPSEADLIEPEE